MVYVLLVVVFAGRGISKEQYICIHRYIGTEHVYLTISLRFRYFTFPFQCKVLNATMVEHVVNPLPQIIPKRVMVLDGIPSLNGSCL